MPAKPNPHQPFLAGFEEHSHLGDPQASQPERSVPESAVSSGASEPPSLEGQTVFVVDAHALIFQVFHAMPEMTGPQGQPVNAVFGFVRDMFLLIDDYAPDYLFCAFDSPGPTFRHGLYEAYKEDREEMPDDLRPQITNIRRMLEAMRIPAVAIPEYEADDIMATMARMVEAAGGDCVLVTSDKDCRQLITPHVKLLNLRKNQLFAEEDLQETWGVLPHQVIDFQALVGDSIDNVPGVPLIGPKIASQLLSEHGTLEKILANPDSLKGAKRRQNLIEAKQQVLLSRKLVALVTDLELDIDWETGRLGPPDSAAFAELCREFGFRGFAKRTNELTGDTPRTDWHADYEVLANMDEVRQLVAQLEKLDRFGITALYDRSTDDSPMAGILGLGICIEPGQAFYLPLRTDHAAIAGAAVLKLLKPALESPRIGKVGTNLKALMTALKGVGIELRGIDFDTTIASFLLQAGSRYHALDELSQRFLQHRPRTLDQLLGTGKQRLAMGDVDVSQLGAYASECSDICLRLRGLMLDELEGRGLLSLHDEIELPLVSVLAAMEFYGIRVDIERLNGLSTEYGERLDALEQEIYALAGREFNIGSPKQLSAVLFDELNLPVIKRTKTGLSTDSEVLEELALVHPLPAQVISYRQFAKLKNTYVDALPSLVDRRTHRIHTSFNQVGAATGRLSSNDPNLQNIPVRTQEGREIRSAFLPGQDDWLLMTADYSQIELRVLAHYSQDQTLLEAFANDEDIHARVAAEVFGTAMEEVTAEMRRRAKAVNFGVIYGQSPFGLAKGLRIEKDEAAEFIERYFEKYSGIGQFMDRVLDDCCRNGYVSTLLGRRRRIDGVRPSRKRRKQKNLAERTAINTVIQGTAADIIKKAMIDVQSQLESDLPEAHMLLQIHDELVFEVPAGQSSDLAALVRQQMETAIELTVSLKVDVKAGDNWSACELVGGTL